MLDQELVGRSKEKEILEQLFQSNKPEFIAIYGRRRVGKTFLIREFFRRKACVFFNATGIYNASLKQQLKEFCKQISNSFFHETEFKQQVNWFDAFELFTKALNTQIPKNKKIVLFFDEFPWMVTPRSKLVQALEYYWNHFWSQDKRIKLVLCGSSASWIIKNIINSKGGLHNRITQAMLLEPMNLRETKSLLHSMGVKLNNKHIVALYMVTGGIPYYLSQIPRKLSATQIIEKLAFSKNSMLLEEFDKLYSSLFQDAASYINIVKVIAAQRNGIRQNDLFTKLKNVSKGGTTIQKLKDLESAGFIISFKPYQNKKKGIFYKVIDEYTLFYFYWIEPIRNTLVKKGLRQGYWDKTMQSSSWLSWAGYAFEAICYKHINQISESLGLSPTALPSNWHYTPKKGSNDQGAQIDLLFDRDDDAITICEIKYTNSSFIINKEYARKINRKFQVFEEQTKTQKQLLFAFISANGLKKNMYSEEMVDEVVVLDDLFKK